MKTCSKCGSTKPEESFHRKGIRCNQCLDCYNEKRAIWREANREKIRQYKTERYAKNAGNIRTNRIKHHHENKERINKKLREKAHTKEYKEKINQKIRNRLLNDPQFKMRRRLRRQVYLALKDRGIKKGDRTIGLLGCSMAHFMKHIESLFVGNISWDTYGVKGWHIDHIVPCAAFDLTKLSERKKCFHWSNLQPLWWSDNISKKDRVLNPNRKWDEAEGQWVG